MQSVNWELKAIVLSTGAIRDSDVKQGQACDPPVFMSPVGTPAVGSVPQRGPIRSPLPATIDGILGLLLLNLKPVRCRSVPLY